MDACRARARAVTVLELSLRTGAPLPRPAGPVHRGAAVLAVPGWAVRSWTPWP